MYDIHICHNSPCVQLSESRTKCELLTGQVDTLQKSLIQEQTKLIQLEQRFSILAKNHEEMIRIKDEYKQTNQHLMAKNKANLIRECTECNNLQEELAVSKLTVSELKQRTGLVETECSKLHSMVTSLEGDLKAINTSSKQKETSLQQKSTGMFLDDSFSKRLEVGTHKKSMGSRSLPSTNKIVIPSHIRTVCLL